MEALDAADSIPILFISGGTGGAGAKTAAARAVLSPARRSLSTRPSASTSMEIASAWRPSAAAAAGRREPARGDGGAFNGNDVRLLGLVDVQSGKALEISTGLGGGISGNGVGGHGGTFGSRPVNGTRRKNSILLNTVPDNVEIKAGNGGSQTTASSPGSGGAGGNMKGLVLTLTGGALNVLIAGGNGGNAGFLSGVIGNGSAGGDWRMSPCSRTGPSPA